MNLLVTNQGYIILHAPKIEYGIYDEPFEKWALLDKNGKVTMYAIDNEYTRVDVDALPEDYEEGKYFYIHDAFVLNEDWEPYIPEEDLMRKEIEQLKEYDTELLYQICLLQLGLTEDDL